VGVPYAVIRAGTWEVFMQVKSAPEAPTRPQSPVSPDLFIPEPDAVRPEREPSLDLWEDQTVSLPSGGWRDRIILATVAGIVRHKFFAFGLLLLCMAAAGLNTLRMDPYYVATATIFPVASDSPVGALGLAGIANLVGGLGMSSGGGSQFPIYENVVHSQHLISELLAMRLPSASGTLMDHLRISELDRTLREKIACGVVAENLIYDTDKKTGLVLISYRDRDPAVAAAVTNRVLQLLNDFDVSTAASQAREKRKFIDARLDEAKQKLLEAESQFENFGEENLRIGKAPELLLQQARLERELNIEQEVYLALRKEAEMARIDEQRSLPVLNVLDYATPPPLPAGPSLVKNVFFGTVMGCFLIFGIFVIAALSPRTWWAAIRRLGSTS
jgi:uncharacterized protein involved in exopolysaccharide biosynthesis